MRTGVIYVIKNTINDKVYVGQTTIPIKERFQAHVRRSKIKSYNYTLYLAMRKYCAENFYFKVIEDNVPINIIDEREVQWIQYYDSYINGYNSTTGGDGRIISKIDAQDEIIKLLDQKKSYEYIASKFNVHKVTIQRTAHILGRRVYKTIPDDELIRRFNEGKTYIEIAGIYNVNKATVERQCHKLNLKRRKDRLSNRDFDYHSFAMDFYSGMDRSRIVEKFNISHTTLWRIKDFIDSQEEYCCYKKDYCPSNVKYKELIANQEFLHDLEVLKYQQLKEKYNISFQTIANIKNRLR